MFPDRWYFGRRFRAFGFYKEPWCFIYNPNNPAFLIVYCTLNHYNHINHQYNCEKSYLYHKCVCACVCVCVCVRVCVCSCVGTAAVWWALTHVCMHSVTSSMQPSWLNLTSDQLMARETKRWPTWQINHTWHRAEREPTNRQTPFSYFLLAPPWLSTMLTLFRFFL